MNTIYKVKKTNRGFPCVDFTDRYGVKCSLQESSLATEAAIWFGCNEASPQVHVNGNWQPVPLPGGTVCNTRMHLTREMVEELLPYLKRFACTGQIGGEEQ